MAEGEHKEVLRQMWKACADDIKGRHVTHIANMLRASMASKKRAKTKEKEEHENSK